LDVRVVSALVARGQATHVESRPEELLIRAIQTAGGICPSTALVSRDHGSGPQRFGRTPTAPPHVTSNPRRMFPRPVRVLQSWQLFWRFCPGGQRPHESLSQRLEAACQLDSLRGRRVPHVGPQESGRSRKRSRKTRYGDVRRVARPSKRRCPRQRQRFGVWSLRVGVDVERAARLLTTG
jgi:hypothetical protein